MNFDPSRHRPLAQLLPDLRRDTSLAADAAALDQWTHRRVFSAVLDGKIPAERINGRWYYQDSDKPEIGRALGVLPRPKVGRPRHAAAPSLTATAA